MNFHHPLNPIVFLFLQDMIGSDRPMDRLVCGDVGFGKTEAAMRAAFRAVDNGRQVRNSYLSLSIYVSLYRG